LSRIYKYSQDIATRDPMLLTNRGKLLEAAKEAVYECGYCFKKGYSQSKRSSKGVFTVKEIIKRGYSQSKRSSKDCSKETIKCAKINKEIRTSEFKILQIKSNNKFLSKKKE